MKIAKLHFLVLAFFINAFLAFSQDAHERHEEVFSAWPLSRVVSELNVTDRYNAELEIELLVDAEYMLFQEKMDRIVLNNPTLSEEEELALFEDFFTEVRRKVDETPVGAKKEKGPEKVLDGPCVNMDFEAGNTTGWSLFTGTRTNATLYNFSGSTPVGPGANHQIFGGGVDPVVGIPRVCPGGNFSCRLGNGTTTGSGAARMTQSFLVDPTNMYFTYNYAVVFQSPNGHAANERPYFTVRVFDAAGNNISCGEYSVYADPLNAASFQSIVVGGNTVLYTNWTSVFTNLSAYVGQNVTIEFTSADCSLGGHYGYAYVDASCAFQQLIASPGFICPGQTTTLTAPAGVGTYLWNTGASTQSITVGTGGTYSCTLTPPQGAACSVVLSVPVTVYPQPTAAFTVLDPTICIGTIADITSTSSIPAPGVISTYQWNFGDGINSPASNGSITGVSNTTGTYTNLQHTYGAVGTYNPVLTVVSTDGCTSTFTTPITVTPLPVLSTTKVDVLCNGGTTGSINLTVSSGTGPFTYLWSNGSTSEDLSSLPAGTYSVVVTDANGCTASTSVTITQPAAPLTLSFTQTDVLCFGSSTGAIDLTVAGGTAPYTYSWSNGATSQDLNSLPFGTYTVTVHDANGLTGGCAATTTVTITQPDTPVALNNTHINVLCNGGATGSIDLTAGGGTPGYIYSWSNGATTEDVSGLIAGTYTVSVHDANGTTGGCAANATVTITQPAAAISLSFTKVNVLCFGGATGSINLSVAGGTAPYTYAWSNGAITEDISGLAAGTYTVVVSDANGAGGGCSATIPVTITQPAAAVSLSTTQTNVLCFGASTGAINLTVAGGTPTYSYVWSNGAVTEDISGLAAGTYTVVVTDANGSTGGCTATISATITQPAAALTVSTTQTNILCFGGNTGAIDLTPIGGTSPYTYLWNTGAVTQDLSGLTAGTYTVNVTDANGNAGSCAATATVTITQPAAALSLSSTHVNVLCNGGNTGSINLTPTGGTAPYTFAWSNGAVTEDLSNLVAGTYTVVVTDANGSTGGCTATTTVTITQPAAPITVSTTQTNVLCFGASTGAINLTVAGGTAPYSYVWSNGAVTEDLSIIPAGTYTVVVTDANGSTGGCTATTTVTITQPAAALTLSATQTNVLCFGGITGAIDLTPAGGTAPYTYSWSNGLLTQDLAGLPAGSYTVNVHDANGIAGSCAATLTITITQPAAPLTLTSTKVNILCNGGNTGSINLIPAGGTAPYTFAWSNGAITEDLSNLVAGTYSVTVTDANGSTGGCTASTSITITQPAAPVSLATTQTNVLCNGAATGAINLTVSGGTSPYSYVWSNGAITEDLAGLTAGTYTVVVSDANGSTGGCTATTTVTITQPAAPLTLSYTQTNVLCNGATTGAIDLSPAGGTAPYTYSWSNGSTSQDLNGLAAGVYTVTVHDANGLTGGCAATATVTITQPTALTQTISAFTYPSGTNISCFGLSDGSINLTIGGGAPGYSYSWSNGAVTEDLTNVPAGSYTVNVTDLNGCIISSSITLTQPLILASGVVPSVFAGGYNLTGCANNGSIDLTVGGGNPAYTYAWSNGATTQDVSALPAGPYSVTVTDVNGCQTTSAITLTQPAPLTQGITAFTYPSGTNISCFGLSDGSIDLTINGGTPNYTYAWSNGATTQDLTNVPAGTYNVTVTDLNGCTITSSITLTQPAAITSGLVPSVYAGGFNVSGCVADGTIDLTVAGGNPGYTYAWSSGQLTEDINGLVAGNYIVNVTDINGCVTTSAITLTQPSGLTQSIAATTFPSGTNISCFGLSDGNIDLTVGGGSPGYTFLWNTGAITEDLTNVPAGTYSVVITDQVGCQISSSITLTQPTLLTQTISAAVYQSGTNISCFGLSDGSVDLTINGGNPGYSYAWSNGAITQDLTNIPFGTYSVLVTDVNGCTIPSTITLIQPVALTQNVTTTTFPSGTNISCFGLSDGNIDLTIGGGNPGYTYAWSNGSLTQDLTNIPAGNYNVTVTDINGCTIATAVTLTQPTSLTQTISSPTYPSGNNISCFGLSDGLVDLTIGGGNPGYTYAWSNGSITQDLAAIPSGTYSVVVTDVNGCTIPSTITLTQPTALTENISATTFPSGTNISCFGLSDGNVDLTINGGSPAYSYSWDNGALTQDLTNVPAGTYNVLVTDINGCSITSTITLTQPPVLTSNVVPFVYPGGFNVSGCLPDGSIDLTVNGGNPGYTYVWSNGANNQDISLLPAGLYSVTVTDLNGCQTTSSVTLTSPAGMTQTITAFTYPSGSNISCIGLSDGSIDLTIGGGVGPYTYAWSNGAVTEDLTNLPAGTYNVIITDQNGCQILSSITLTQPTALAQNITAFTYPSGDNISCFGLSDGSIDLTINGGNPAYSYLWSTGATTEDISGLPIGTYTVLVTDVNGCTIPSSITLVQPSPLTESTSAFVYPSGDNISCFGLSDGSVDLTIGGGSPGYTYVWNTGALTQDITTLPVGTYTAVTTDLNGCTINSTITLIQPTAITQTISSATYPSGTNISCFGLSDGSIDLTPNNGSPGYTYAWSNGANTQDISGIPAGTYNVVITDLNGCTLPSSITLLEPTALTQSISAFAYPSGDNISCYGFNDGSIDLTIGGGNPGYTYLWNNGFTTEDIGSLTAGTYTVLVTDINGCTIPSAITLFEPTPLTESNAGFTFIGGNNISCFGFSDGTVDLTIGGGSPNYTYVWSTGATTEDINGLPIGTYSVIATDINGCTINSTITLTEPTPMTYTETLSLYSGGFNVTGCIADGTIDLTPGGSIPGYTYSWSNGQITQDIANLGAGTYTVTITDANGCELIVDTTLIAAPQVTSTTQVTSNYNGQDISCFGASDGAISVTGNGGAPAYTYDWTNAAGTSVSANQNPTGLPSGLYIVTVSDQNGCTTTNNITLVDPPAFTFGVAVSTNYNGQDISCFGMSDGGIDLTVSGATPGYTYAWTNSLGGNISVIEDPQGLPDETYSVLVTDLNGCFFTTNITLTEPPLLTGVPSVTSDYNGQDVSCFNSTDGTITLAPTGGTPTYFYSWTDPTGNVVGVGQNQTNVGAGTYSMVLTDLNGCTFNTSILVTQPPQLIAGTTIVSNYFGQGVSCEGATDGIIQADVVGGTPGYSYSWNSIPVQTSNPAINLGTGTYTVIVTDANGCVSSSVATLTANPLPSFDLPPVVYSCEGYPVAIDSQAEPGSSCNWVFSDGQVINDCGPVYVTFPNTPACYDVQLTVINAQGCINSTNLNNFICVVPNPNASFSIQDYTLSTTHNSTVFYNNSTGAQDYYWNFGDGSAGSTLENPYHQFPTEEGFTGFDIWLYAVSEYGCIDSTVRNIVLKEDLILYVPNTFTPDGDEYNNSFFPVLSSGYSEDGYAFMIFNRWGELIFESHDVTVGWDGTYHGVYAQDGTYTWKLIVKNKETDDKEQFVGHVNLLR
jgi:gliding motility-associated-like protein